MKWLVVIGLVGLLLLNGCVNSPPTSSEKFSVAATFFPLYDITKKIAGDKADVFSVIPNGVEPHEYEATPLDIASFNQANVFVTLGIEFAPFENQLVQGKGTPITIISASQGITLRSAPNGPGDEPTISGKDVHIWLSPKNMKVMVNNITTGLKQADATNASVYAQNASGLLAQLDQLDADYKNGLADCNKHIVLVNHNAFSYLAADYGFSTIFISGLSPESEPSPQQVKALVDAAKANDLKYVFYEELVDPRTVESIAQEIHGKALELSPLEGTRNANDDYFSVMHRNLMNLKLGLECS